MVLILIALDMTITILKNDESTINFNIITLILIAFTVSLDSFATGLGLSALTSNIIIAGLIFTICSSTITFIGLKLGEYSKIYLGKYANIIGILLLFIIGIKSLIV